MTKKTLHWSDLSVWESCGERYRRAYVEEEVVEEPPTIALSVGSLVHEAIEAQLTHKLAHDSLMSERAIRGLCARQVKPLLAKGLTVGAVGVESRPVGLTADRDIIPEPCKFTTQW